jgi:hypothetical protein
MYVIIPIPAPVWAGFVETSRWLIYRAEGAAKREKSSLALHMRLD